MRYAIIDGINVINIIDYDEQPSNPPPAFDNPIIAVQSDNAQIGWDYLNKMFIPPESPIPTPEELMAECKLKAQTILSNTDWTTIADVADPIYTPYLMNQSEFKQYRAIIRNYAVNPVADPVWPTQPTEQWSS